MFVEDEVPLLNEGEWEAALHMDECVQLTDTKTGRQDLAEIGACGRSEVTATCGASGRKGAANLTRDALRLADLEGHCPSTS